ncbi:hypothetical protein DL95DRAFT_397342, partial [Leptodontidium sp. 2 PMI_412]
MRHLAEKYSGVYMNKVLLEALKDFNIKYNIISITRDNASSNDTLITAFIKHYAKEAIKFQGDTPYFSIWKKIRKIIISLKYGQENKRILQAQIKAYNIEKLKFLQLDQKTRWSLIYYMLKNFLHFYELVKATINSSTSIINNLLLLTEIEITWLENVLVILAIFVKATTKLQAEKYLTIYYIIPEVFLIYTKLENFKVNFQLFINAINSGIAKLRKYYPRLGILNNK